MSDEELSPETAENTETMSDTNKNSDAVASNESLREKFRLTGDEQILKDVKPSLFAFLPMYVIALVILGAHMLFAVDWDASSDDNILVKVMIFLIELSDIGEIGFVLVMLSVTWFNRMLNGTTSGKWTTIFLLIVAFTPPVLRLDDFIAWIMGKDSGFIPLDDFSYSLFGIVWASLFTLFTIFYQRSFHYAITNHRVIFTQHLVIPGDGRRILFDNINEIRTQRTMLGAMFGYNTIICDTGSQLGIGEDAMSVSVGSAGSGATPETANGEGQITKNIFRKMFAFVTYQRTRKIDLPDPRFSFFCITNWKSIEQLLNEMHQRHSQSGILNELKDQIAESQD
tara:strand:+ start:10615 stop:11634 length:1020 start_codon:yes stop_codon:yes gene_type:complete